MLIYVINLKCENSGGTRVMLEICKKDPLEAVACASN